MSSEIWRTISTATEQDVVLPLARIGNTTKAFKGTLDNLKLEKPATLLAPLSPKTGWSPDTLPPEGGKVRLTDLPADKVSADKDKKTKCLSLCSFLALAADPSRVSRLHRDRDGQAASERPCERGAGFVAAVKVEVPRLRRQDEAIRHRLVIGDQFRPVRVPVRVLAEPWRSSGKVAGSSR